MILTFTVDGEDRDIDSVMVTGLRRESESVTTLILDDDTTISVTEPFDSVHDKLIVADSDSW